MEYTKPAFPSQIHDGLTDRQLIGAMMLQGIMSNPEAWASDRRLWDQIALDTADSFLELEKKTRK